MGLAKPAVNFLIREHLRKPLEGPVLTLGRQDVQATMREVRDMLCDQGLAPPPTAGNQPISEGDAKAQKTPISDIELFACLGLDELFALDCSDYESATIVSDLNRPVAEELHNHFGCVLDGGTCEHVFDVRQSLANVAQMVRPGGRVIHLSPMNNYANHGFYQLSPTLFFDYYSENRFDDLRGYVVEQRTSLLGRTRWNLFEWDVSRGDHHLTSRDQLLCIFVAEKTPTSTCHAVPIQSSYRRRFQDAAAAATPNQLRQRYRHLPQWLRQGLRRFVPRLDPARKPWWLKRTARLR